MRHLATWVAALTNVTTSDSAGLIDEILNDEELQRRVSCAIRASPRHRVADSTVRFGRRLGWYAMVRALKPSLVVETGTDKGLGSCVLARALERNGTGHLITIDTNPTSGALVTGPEAAVTDRIIGDSVAVLGSLERSVDFFLHDSLHTYEHERAELEAVEPWLSQYACVISDNAHVTDALLDWSTERGRTFSFFREVPLDHWYPGAGIAASITPPV